jgi:hypothetical protein
VRSGSDYLEEVHHRIWAQVDPASELRIDHDEQEVALHLLDSRIVSTRPNGRSTKSIWCAIWCAATVSSRRSTTTPGRRCASPPPSLVTGTASFSWRSGTPPWPPPAIDPDDYETPVGHRVYLGDLHYYYRISSMVEEIHREKKNAELREKNTEEKPENLSDIPF